MQTTNWKDEDLIFACYGKNYPQAIELLELGADPNVRPPEEWWEDDPDKWKEFCTPLHYACKHGELEFIKLLIEKYKCNLNTRDGHVRSPLHIACQYGHLNVAQYIIEQKGDLSLLEDTSKSKMTPLHYACQYGQTEVVEYLVRELGCQLDVFDRENQSPLHYACEKGYTRIALYLCEHGSKLQVRDKNQSTPLHLTSKCGNTEIAKYLLDHGCEPDTIDVNQWTPLHYACQYGYIEIVQSLHAHGCNPEPRDGEQLTPLHIAISKWKCTDKLSLEVVKFLISVAHVSKRKTGNGEDALLLASREGRFPIMQFLAVNGQYDVSVQDKDGNTPLHFACRRSKAFNWKPIIKWLLEDGGGDPSVKNTAGETPFQLATDNSVKFDLLRHGATPSNVYEVHGRGLGLRQPLQPSLDLFVVGSYSTGKSTLMMAFRKASSKLMRVINQRRRVSGVSAKTAGIVPQEFKSKQYGHISLFDCAGRKEFHDSHAALLNNAIQCVPPVFVIVVNLTQSSEEIQHDVLYWLSLLESQCSPYSNANVVIVGSHADVLLSRRENPNQKLEGVVATLPQFKSFNSPAFIAMNCQYPESTEMTQLRRIVKTSSDATHTSEVIHFNTHCLYTYILNQFKGLYAVPLRQIQANIHNEKCSATEHDIVYFLPSSISALHKVCKELNNQTHLLYLINPVTIQDSCIVVDKSALLSEVIGTIFAPADFKQHGQLASSMGIVPLSTITQQFSHYDPEMLVGFLSTLEHCLELSYQQIIESFPQHAKSDFKDTAQQQSPDDRYLLFPGLVTLEAPSDVWQTNPQYSHHCGWILQCSHANQFFTLHFIRAIVLRLVKSLALDPECSSACHKGNAVQQECLLWKNGLHWKNNCGVEALVEEASQSKEIVVLMRCSEACILKCLQVRSHIIRNVLKAASEMCGSVDTTELFIHPAETMQHPLKPTSHIDLFRLTDIAKAVVTSTPSVVSTFGKTLFLQEVTMFDPYAGLGEPLLRRLFDEQSHSYYSPLPDGLITQIAREISDKKEKFVEIFKTDSAPLHSEQDTTSTNEVNIITVLQSWREASNGTLQLLQETLDQYSAFSGKSPLVSCYVCVL